MARSRHSSPGIQSPEVRAVAHACSRSCSLLGSMNAQRLDALSLRDARTHQSASLETRRNKPVGPRSH